MSQNETDWEGSPMRTSALYLKSLAAVMLTVLTAPDSRAVYFTDRKQPSAPVRLQSAVQPKTVQRPVMRPTPVVLKAPVMRPTPVVRKAPVVRPAPVARPQPVITNQPRTATPVTQATPLPAPKPQPTPKTAPQTAPKDGNVLSYETTIQFTYGQLLEYLTPAAQEALDSALNQDCYNTKKKRGPYNAQFKSTYNCGEVPYGKIINKVPEKSVFDLNLAKGKVLFRYKGDLTEARAGEEAVGDIRMLKPFQLQVRMNRKQKASYVTSPLLDTKKNASLKVSSNIGETVTIRNTPKSGALYSLVCAYLPGFQVRSLTNTFHAEASYRWRFWIFSATERLSVSAQIHDGALKSDSSKACATIRTTVQQAGSEYTPKVQVLDVSYPTTQGLKLTGLKPKKVDVHIHTLGLKIANFILRILGKDDIQMMITKNIQDQMKQTVDPMIRTTLKDVETGKVFEQMIEETLKNKPVKDIVAAYKTAIKSGVEAQELTYKADISAQCMEYVTGYLSDLGIGFVPNAIRDYCSNMIADLDLMPFVKDTDYEKKGCYAHPHSPLPYTAKGANTWWKDQCGFTARARVTVPIEIGEELQCLQETLEKIQRGEPVTEEEYLACAEDVISGLTGLIPEIIEVLDQIKTWLELETEILNTGIPEVEAKEIMKKSRRVLKLK